MLRFPNSTEPEGTNSTSITLKAARINAGLTQDQAAKAFGVSKNIIKAWESHPGEIKVKYLPQIEKAYGFPVENIIFFS